MADQALFFDPADPAFVEDPYPFYRLLRDERPAYRDPESGLWFITRYADVERATTDHATFSSARGNVVIDSPTRVGKTLGSLDPPRHDELRLIIQRSLSAARIDAALPAIRAATRDRLEALRHQRHCDVIEDVGRPILFGALARLLGLDDEAALRATELTAGLFHQDEGMLGPILQPGEFQAISRFLSDQLAGRSIEPNEDLFSVLLDAKEAGAPLDDPEIVANLSTVLMAGNASIGHFFPNLLNALWLHPDQRRRVAANPSRLLAAIDEAARWDTSTQCFARQVTRDIEVGGTIIPANARALIFYASANRDERAIGDPDRFDVDRKRMRHFGFGMGPHVCAGAIVARTMLRAILEELLPFLGDYELHPDRAVRVKHIMVRGFVRLPMSW